MDKGTKVAPEKREKNANRFVPEMASESDDAQCDLNTCVLPHLNNRKYEQLIQHYGREGGGRESFSSGCGQTFFLSENLKIGSGQPLFFSFFFFLSSSLVT